MSAAYYNKLNTSCIKGTMNLVDSLLLMNNFILFYFRNQCSLYFRYTSFFQSNRIANFIYKEFKNFMADKIPALSSYYNENGFLNPKFYLQKKVKYSTNEKQIVDRFKQNIYGGPIDNYLFSKKNAYELVSQSPSSQITQIIDHLITNLINQNILCLNYSDNDTDNLKCKKDLKDLTEDYLNKTCKKYINPFQKDNLTIPEISYGQNYNLGFLVDFTLFDYHKFFLIDEIDKQFVNKKSLKTKIDKALDIEIKDIDISNIMIDRAIDRVVEKRIKHLKNFQNPNVEFDYVVDHTTETKILIKMTYIPTKTDVYITISCRKNKSINRDLNDFRDNMNIFDNVEIYTQTITSSRLIQFIDTVNDFYNASLGKGNRFADVIPCNFGSATPGMSLHLRDTYSSSSFVNKRTNLSFEMDIEAHLSTVVNITNSAFKIIDSMEDYILKALLIDYFDRVISSNLIFDIKNYVIETYSRRAQVPNLILGNTINVYDSDNLYPDLVVRILDINFELYMYLICYPRNDKDMIFMFTSDKKLGKLMNKRYDKKNLYSLPKSVTNYLNNKCSDKEFYHVFTLKNELNDQPLILENLQANLACFAPEMLDKLDIQFDNAINRLNLYLTNKE